MNFDGIAVGTRRASCVAGLDAPHGSKVPPLDQGAQTTSSSVRRRSSVQSLKPGEARRRSSAISLNFENRKGFNKQMDEPILLCRDKETYLFFSMTSDGMLNYKMANKVQGSMSKYLVDRAAFNPEGAPVVVLSSPTSGDGLAEQTYTRLLLPILRHFNVAHSHIALKDSKTATYLASHGQFTAGTIFILLCGDGVIHEIINGLAINPHFEELGTTIKICPIPNGSGNGLSNSLKIANLAQGIRAIFKNNFQPLPLMSVKISSRSDRLYAAVVVSIALHAALVRDCDQEEYKQKYGSNRFQEVAKMHLSPPHVYRAALDLTAASRFPDFSSPGTNQQIGQNEHTYCLITRCSNLEANWKIAPLASPIGNNDRVDVVRMGPLSAADLGSILMDGYKEGAQINREAFEYYRASGVRLQVLEPDAHRRVVCIDGATIEAAAGDVIEVETCMSLGPMKTIIQVQKL